MATASDWSIPDKHETDDGQYIDPTHTGTDPLNPDTDGDGIWDGDEVYGTVEDLDLPAMGASPVRKDIFVEIDWMVESEDCGSHSHRPSAQAIADLQAAFAASPVVNPYGGPTGISLHVDYGQGAPFVNGTNIGNDPFVVFDSEFNGYKAVFFNAARK